LKTINTLNKLVLFVIITQFVVNQSSTMPVTHLPISGLLLLTLMSKNSNTKII